MQIKKTLVHCLSAGLIAAAISPLALADNGSETISQGAMSVAASPVISIRGQPFEGSTTGALGSALVVVGISQSTANGLHVIFEKAADGSKATVAISADLAKSVGLAVGSTVDAVSEAAGYSLVYSGKLLAFIPNAAGLALLHHERITPAEQK